MACMKMVIAGTGVGACGGVSSSSCPSMIGDPRNDVLARLPGREGVRDLSWDAGRPPEPIEKVIVLVVYKERTGRYGNTEYPTILRVCISTYKHMKKVKNISDNEKNFLGSSNNKTVSK